MKSRSCVAPGYGIIIAAKSWSAFPVMGLAIMSCCIFCMDCIMTFGDGVFGMLCIMPWGAMVATREAGSIRSCPEGGGGAGAVRSRVVRRMDDRRQCPGAGAAGLLPEAQGRAEWRHFVRTA